MAYPNRQGRVMDSELRAQLEEAKAMSASFTRAGGKSRPGGSRGSMGRAAVRGGRPFQSVPARNSSVGFSSNCGTLESRNVVNGPSNLARPTMNPPIFKAPSPTKPRSRSGFDGGIGPPKSQPSMDGYGVQTSYKGQNTSGHPTSTMTSTFGVTTPPVPATGTTMYYNTHTTHQPTAAVQSTQFQSTSTFYQHLEEPQLIVTNWTEDTGPFIPAHLRQKSAFQAIQEMADMIHQPVDAITADGVSIPRPREGVRSQTPSVKFSAPVSYQPDMNRSGWHTASAATNSLSAGQGHVADPDNRSMKRRLISYSDMDIDEKEDTGNKWNAPVATRTYHSSSTPNPSITGSRPADLSGSVWSDKTWDVAAKPSYNSTSTTFTSRSGLRSAPSAHASFLFNADTKPFAPTAGATNLGWGGNASAPAPNASTGYGGDFGNNPASPGATNPSPAKTEKRIKTLADSMWA